MDNERKRMRFEVFIERYFGNFHRILLTNILFAVPSAIILAILYFISIRLLPDAGAGFYLFSIIPLYPFYAGVVMVVRDIARGDSEVRTAAVFFKAVKDNFPRFLLHGAVVCAAAMFSYYSIRFYVGMLSVSWLMYAVLFVCIFIVLLALYASFYLPLMAVTYDIKLRYLYKNCFLMSFGEFKNNLFATFAIAVVAAICLTVTAFSGSVAVLVIILSVLWVFLIPATYTFCYTFFVYDGMVAIIREKGNKGQSEDEKAALKDKPENRPSMAVEYDFSDIDVSKLRDTDDFIFHNGRMIKQSVLLRMIKEKQTGSADEVSEDE